MYQLGYCGHHGRDRMAQWAFMLSLVIWLILPISAMAAPARPMAVPEIVGTETEFCVRPVFGPPLFWLFGVSGGFAGLGAATASIDPYEWAAAGAGAIVGLVTLNIVTGGAALTPIVGASLAAAVGGNLLAAGAMTPVAQQAAMTLSALVAGTIAGGFVGTWLYGEFATD